MKKGTIINDYDLIKNGWIFVCVYKETLQKWERGGKVMLWDAESQEVIDIFFIG